jgi:hypothetical protein
LEEVTKDKGQLDGYRRIKEDEILAVKKELDDASFKLKEIKMKYENLEGRYAELDKEYQISKKDNEIANKELYEV